MTGSEAQSDFNVADERWLRRELLLRPTSLRRKRHRRNQRAPDMLRKNDDNNVHALSALKDKRAMIVGEIAQLRRKIRVRQDALANVDATIRLLDPECQIDPFVEPDGYGRLFLWGELRRLILDALRKAEGRPLLTSQIVTAILEAKGAPEAARPTLGPKVRMGLAYLARKAAVASDIQNRRRQWRL